MPLAATAGAIGAVSQVLHDHLVAQLPALGDVTVGRPQLAAGAHNPRLNLFLYEVQFDGYLRNIALEEDGAPPLWLALRYLLTAFDDQGESDTIDAHTLLGDGIRSLQAANFSPPPGTINDPLDDSPDLLKVTFDDATPELLSRLMQGTDEKYRCSVGFQVRPIMIAPPERPSSALLVGIDYTAGGAVLDAERAVGLAPVMLSLGPQLVSVSPESFEAGAALVVRGSGLDSLDIAVELHGAPLTIVEQRADRIEAIVPTAFNDAPSTSAGAWPLVAVRLLGGGPRRRSSNPLIAGLRPVLSAAVPGADFLDTATGTNYRTVDLAGRLLGTAADDAVAALLRNGVTYGPYDRLVDPTGTLPVAQSQRQLQIPAVPALTPGDYRLILRVNGQQALNSPTVTFVR